MKKTIALILFVCYAFSSCVALTKNSQKINNSNYYDFFNPKPHFALAHLKSSFVVPIIIDELKKCGVAEHNISIGKLLKMNDSTYVVAAVYVYNNNHEYGFVYESSFSGFPDVHDRDYFADPTKIKYAQPVLDIEKNYGDELNIDVFPDNLFLFRASCYWYQFKVEDESEYPVTIKVIESILRQDIRDCLNKINI